MVQEIHRTSPAIREACEASISDHAATVAVDIAEAMKLYRVRAGFSAESLALHTQAVIQGAFTFSQRPEAKRRIAAESIDHLRRYIELLFQSPKLRSPRRPNEFLSRDVSRRSKTSANMMAWNALSEDERKAKEREGMAAWRAWAEKHHADIVSMGGPLGKTKKVSQQGVADVGNEMGAFTIVRAVSHEAAAKLFEGHPHFSIFPGEAVEIMPVQPIPGAP